MHNSEPTSRNIPTYHGSIPPHNQADVFSTTTRDDGIRVRPVISVPVEIREACSNQRLTSEQDNSQNSSTKDQGIRVFASNLQEADSSTEVPYRNIDEQVPISRSSSSSLLPNTINDTENGDTNNHLSQPSLSNPPLESNVENAFRSNLTQNLLSSYHLSLGDLNTNETISYPNLSPDSISMIDIPNGDTESNSISQQEDHEAPPEDSNPQSSQDFDSSQSVPSNKTVSNKCIFITFFKAN